MASVAASVLFAHFWAHFRLTMNVDDYNLQEALPLLLYVAFDVNGSCDFGLDEARSMNRSLKLNVRERHKACISKRDIVPY
jgi:hypothetical protein